MKAYVLTTGIVFALVVVAHLWRVAAEGSQLVTESSFVLTTAASAALSVWAWRLLTVMPPR